MLQANSKREKTGVKLLPSLVGVMYYRLGSFIPGLARLQYGYMPES